MNDDQNDDRLIDVCQIYCRFFFMIKYTIWL